MKRFYRKAPLLALALALTLGAAACSGGGAPSNGASSGGGSSGGGSSSGGASSGGTGAGSTAPATGDNRNGADEVPMTNGKYDPPITITTVRGMPAAATYKNGETADDNVHYRWAKEALGIEIRNLWSVVNTNEAYSNKLKLSLSADEPMPDIVFAQGATGQLLIDSGKFVDAGVLFDQYAGDKWKAAMAEAPSVWNEFTRDGVRYGIPMLDYDYNNDPVLWVREDWMQKLNLAPPRTIEEFEQLLDAFTFGDPNGNGENDTYGIAAGFNNSYSDAFNLGWVFGAYGSMPNTWLPLPDGTLGYGSVQPEIKAGLAKLKEWFGKGYLPIEAGLWDAGKAGAFVAAGRAGAFSGPFWSEAWPMGELNSNVPGAKLITFPLPVGPDGQSMHFGTQPYKGAIFINKDMKHPEAFFTYANYLFDHVAEPETGGEFEHGWAKGYDWDIVDGEATQDLTKIPGGGVRVFFYSLLDQGPRIPSQVIKALVKLHETGKPETPFEAYWNNLAPDIEKQAAVHVWSQRQFSVKGEFSGTTPAMNEKWDYLYKLELQTFSDIVFGNKPVDAFDDFVNQWKAQGGEEVTKEVNEWHQSVRQ